MLAEMIKIHIAEKIPNPLIPSNFIIIKVVRKFGKACSYPGTYMGSIHAILSSKSYKSAIIKTIKAGGCNCSRANFVGAYFVASKGLKNIPKHWIKKTKVAKEISCNF